MWRAIAIAVLLLGGCSDSTSSPPVAKTSPPTSSTDVEGSETCSLLKAREVERLLGDEGVATPGQTGSTPNCQWISSDGRYVQVIQTSASTWAEGLPAALKAIEESGLFSDPENVRKLREGSRLVESGKSLNAGQACSMFSRMAELQGRPSGSDDVATVVPTLENPLAVTSQICSGGTFTSVLLATKARGRETFPLEKPLRRRDDITEIAQSIHSRAVG